MPERKSEQVKQLLVRYLRDAGLKRGDRLPSQEFFRLRFGCGTATVTAAINELRSDGVLEVRDKVGIFVIDPNADGHAGRVIGVVTRHVTGSPYYSSLLWALQTVLIASGCMVRIFAYGTKNDHPFDFTLNDFPGLRRSIENHELDGVIHLDDFRKSALSFLAGRNIPCLFVGSVGVSPNGLFFDQHRVLREMVHESTKYPNEPTALLLPESIRSYLEAEYRELAGAGAIIFGGYELADGRRFAGDFLALPPEIRPRTLLMLDDLLGLAMLSELATHLSPEEMPRAIILRNRQLCLSFPVREATYFTIDLACVAERAVALLFCAMKSGTPKIGCHMFTIEKEN